MKFTTALALLVSCIAVATAHGGLLYPPPRGGIEAADYNGRFHAFIGFEDKKQKLEFPCGGYAPLKTPTPMRAGETIPVRFYASDMDADDIAKQPKETSKKKQFKQARHGGGMCEFSLSYDNGETFHLIGRYTKTCPDSYHEWPVTIPENVPSCTKKNKCLFVWTWTANILPQFYMNCADIKLKGVKGGKRPKGKILIVDFKGEYQGKAIKRGVRAQGDGVKHLAGDGPDPNEKKANSNKRRPNYPRPALIGNN
ncbi:hypothetical protein BGZ70_004960 [Mortierella alpina]|uniref:Lytic polysaccharide monooxygenase n=1 Tax=Mortierella alpina TaxID=64518 RepID=A0A9P6JE66_MORAP|nr:hypothetical protein BGZ70_004960 [Mortierella alpina]